MAGQPIIEAEYIQAGGADDPDLNQAFYDFADQIKSEANSGGSIAVFEVPVDANGTPRPTTYNKTKLFTVPVGSASLDDICDRVLREFVEPGGKIMVQLLARKDGERGVKLNRMIPLRRGKLDTSGKSDGSTAGDIERLMRMMDERRARDLADMRTLIEQNRAPVVDPLAQSLAITEKLTNMAVAMRSGQVSGGAPANDPNAVMQQMMAMMMTGMMKKFMAGMDGSEKAAPENTNWLKDIVALAQPLLAAKAAQEQKEAAREQRMLVHERAAPQPPASVESDASAPKTSTEKEKNDMKLIAMLSKFLPVLIDNFAAKDADPADVAKLTMDNLPEDDAGMNDALYQLIQSPADEFLAKLATMDARVKNHAAWMEEFRVALLAAFEPDERIPQTQGEAK